MTDSLEEKFGSDSIFEEWLEEKRTPLTLIGVFGGLSVYLTQIPTEISVYLKAGIAGSLLIFFILTFLVLIDGVAKALDCVNRVSLHVFTFMYMTVGLVGILIAVLSILGKYSNGAFPLIDVGSAIGILLFYIGVIFVEKPFSDIKTSNRYRQTMAYSPYISLVWVFISEFYNRFQGESSLLQIIAGDSYSMGIFLLVITHLSLILLILGFLILAEFVVYRLPDLEAKKGL